MTYYQSRISRISSLTPFYTLTKEKSTQIENYKPLQNYPMKYQELLGIKFNKIWQVGFLSKGYIVAFSFGKGAYEEVVRLKNKGDLHIELVKVEDLLYKKTS